MQLAHPPGKQRADGRLHMQQEKDSIDFKARFPTDVTYTGNNEGGTECNFLKEDCGLLMWVAL